jgi:hypothetical protein
MFGLSPSRPSMAPLGLPLRTAVSMQKEVKPHIIKASLLISGRGEPIKDAAVVIHHDDKID